MAHRYWEYGPEYVNQLNHLLKNLAIIGGLLYVKSTIDSKFNSAAIRPRRAGVPGAGAKAVAAGA